MNVKNATPISIVTVADNHFAVLLAGLLKSIEVNHKTDEPINIYIVSDKISASNKKKLVNSCTSALISFTWFELADVISRDIKLPLDNTSWPMNVYARFLIPYFIPQDVEKVIYLDVDMIVVEDISKLWHIDLKDHIIAGVVDVAKKVSSPWGGIKNYKELGLDPETKYFNSGLFIIDTFKWRKENITEKVFECVEKNKKHILFSDQYGMNVIMANRWLELDQRWNCYSYLDIVDPYIIHFTGRKPIFKKYDFNKQYKEEFFKYLSLTGWKNFKPVGESNRYGKKLFNLVHKKVIRLFNI